MPKGPINYSTACIYQICCRDLEITDLYVGSTTDLIKRRCAHKSACTNKSGKNYNLHVYQFIRDHGGWDNWEVVKVQDVDCACREDLIKTERAYMERLGATLNKNVPGRSREEWYEVNKDYWKEYWEENKERLNEKNRQYNEAHRTELKEKRDVKVQCQCGSMVGKYYMTRHCKTAKHTRYLESLK